MSKTKKEIGIENAKKLSLNAFSEKDQEAYKNEKTWEAILQLREADRISSKLLDTACARIKMLEEELRSIQVYLQEDQAIEVSDDDDFIEEEEKPKKKKSKYNLKENQEDFSQE